MKLRKLKYKDAPLMLEWMHDSNVTHYLRADFSSKTIFDAEQFIKSSWSSIEDLHYAIVSEEDEYMGTVSLKYIESDSAEFAIVVRKIAMGKGYAWFGIKTIINKAFDEIGLKNIYWCVSRENTRAIRFYDKHYFHEAIDIPKVITDRYTGIGNLKWYSALRGDVFIIPEHVAGCNVYHIKTIPTVKAGELSFFEGNIDIPFKIKRIYYISKVPEGTKRGYHAHKKLKQLLFCPYGRIQLILENNHGREEIELSDPSIAVLIDRPTWREMIWLQKDSVLCVAASEYYDASDYIRDYSRFRSEYIENMFEE